MRFKVGDKVIVTCDHPHGAHLLKNDLVTIDRIDASGEYYYTQTKCSGLGTGWALYDYELEPFVEYDVHAITEQLNRTARIIPMGIPLIKTTLPTDSNDRKNYPLFRGVLRYFPAALAGIARTSKLGNDKHNPGEEMYHARGKSTDTGDCIVRHLVDVEDLLAAFNRGDCSVTTEQILTEVNQMAWRALAFSQEMHEKFGSPLAPGAKK